MLSLTLEAGYKCDMCLQQKTERIRSLCVLCKWHRKVLFMDLLLQAAFDLMEIISREKLESF